MTSSVRKPHIALLWCLCETRSNRATFELEQIWLSSLRPHSLFPSPSPVLLPCPCPFFLSPVLLSCPCPCPYFPIPFPPSHPRPLYSVLLPIPIISISDTLFPPPVRLCRCTTRRKNGGRSRCPRRTPALRRSARFTTTATTMTTTTTLWRTGRSGWTATRSTHSSARAPLDRWAARVLEPLFFSAWLEVFMARHVLEKTCWSWIVKSSGFFFFFFFSIAYYRTQRSVNVLM